LLRPFNCTAASESEVAHSMSEHCFLSCPALRPVRRLINLSVDRDASCASGPRVISLPQEPMV
jgi:hypothetical protein